MSMKVKSSVLSIPIYIETTKVEGLSHLTKYPYVRENDVFASGVVKKQPFSNLCKSYRNDDRFENHWFYYRGTPRGYMITLDLFIFMLEDMNVSEETIRYFREENNKWLK